MAIKQKNQRGFSLLIALIFMSVMLSFGLALSSLSYKQQILASSAVESQYAFYAADAGLECGLYADQQQHSFLYPASDPGSVAPIACDGGTIASETYVYNSPSSSNPELVVSERISLDAGARCADITVYKPDPTNVTPELTSNYVFSQGYDVPCSIVAAGATSGARIASRGLEARY